MMKSGGSPLNCSTSDTPCWTSLSDSARRTPPFASRLPLKIGNVARLTFWIVVGPSDTSSTRVARPVICFPVASIGAAAPESCASSYVITSPAATAAVVPTIVIKFEVRLYEAICPPEFLVVLSVTPAPVLRRAVNELEVQTSIFKPLRNQLGCVANAAPAVTSSVNDQIGRASCRERV